MSNRPEDLDPDRPRSRREIDRDYDDDADDDIRRIKKGDPGDNDLTTADILLAILCSGIGCIMGIVYLVQGKPKAGKMIGLSLLFSLLWTGVRVIIETNMNR